MFIFSLIFLPFRIVTSGLTFLFAVGLANFIVGNTSLKSRQPQSSVKRRFLLPLFRIIARAVYFFGGVHYVKIKGTRASRTESPILVLGPHSSVIDTLAIVVMDLPSCVATSYHATSVVGGLIRLLQPILVYRDNPNSRKVTLEEIVNRVKSTANWPQLAVFPEGTCANRQYLIPFRQGAFLPGVPVQPVLIRYPNNVDTLSWVTDGPSVWTMLFMTFTQLFTRMELEFLPVYTPNEQERNNPQLFANNVRQLMANKLNIPTCDFSYDDFCRMRVAIECGVPDPEGLVFVHGLMQLMFESQYIQKQSCADWIQSRLNELLAVAKLSASLSQSEFERTLFADTQLTDRGKLLLRLAAVHFSTKSSAAVDFRLFCTRACLLLHANNPQKAFELVINAFPSDQTTAEQNDFQQDDTARVSICTALGIRQSASLDNELIDRMIALWKNGKVFPANIYATIQQTCPELVTCLEQYQSALSEALGQRGRPLLELGANGCKMRATSQSPCDIDLGAMKNGNASMKTSTNGVEPINENGGAYRRKQTLITSAISLNQEPA